MYVKCLVKRVGMDAISTVAETPTGQKDVWHMVDTIGKGADNEKIKWEKKGSAVCESTTQGV